MTWRTGWPAALRERLRATLWRRREERELAEELRFHLEMETAANVARGHAPAEARRRALVAFGGVARFTEEVREARGAAPLERVARDLRLAVRRLLREPGYAAPTIATLGLGIGVATAVFALVYAVLLAPLPYRDAGRLVTLRHTASGAELPMDGLSDGVFHHYRAGNRVFDEVASYLDRIRTLTDGEQPEQIRMLLVSPSFFPLLRPPVVLGRLPQADDFVFGERSGVLLAHDLWVRRYGADSGVVGRTIEIDRGTNVVVGVAAPGFSFPDRGVQAWVVYPDEVVRAAIGQPPRASLRGLYASGLARLKPGVTTADAERDLARLVRTLPDAYGDVTAQQLDELGLRPVVTPLRASIVGDVRAALLLLAGAGAFLLGITWANATNLTLVRGERLRREVAVARALGAGGGDLTRRFLCEGTVLALLGGALGLALAVLAVRLRFGFAPGALPRLDELRIGALVPATVAALTLASVALLASVSRVAVRRTNVAAVLAGGSGRMTSGHGAQVGRRVLVTAQVALALTLLVGSALMAQSFHQLRQVRLGFEPSRALTFFLPVTAGTYSDYHRMAGLHHEILGRLRALPGVRSVEAGNIAVYPLTPVPSYYNARIADADARPADAPAATDSAIAPYTLFGFATPGYFRSMGIPIVRGRTFEAADTGREAHGVIVSASLAHSIFGTTDVVGRRVRWAGRTRSYPAYTVVGVAGDVPGESIQSGPSRALYFPHIFPPRADTITGPVHMYVPSDEMYVVHASQSPETLVPAIREAVRAVDPKLVVTRVSTLAALAEGAVATARLTMLLLAVAAATALALGVIGIYGVLAYAVAERTPELGIRIALGAEPARVVRTVVRQGVMLALAGTIAGLAAAFALTRLLRGLLYEVSPSDPLAYASMAALLLAVAVVASWIPARRAGRIDPVRALRG